MSTMFSQTDHSLVSSGLGHADHALVFEVTVYAFPRSVLNELYTQLE